MTKEELDFIGSMNMCDEISNEAYEKIVCHAEETIVSEDCVSRKAVIKALNDNWLSGSCARRIIDEQIDEVNALPPVTPTHKVGKWIYHFERDDYNDYENEYYECPFCHDLGGDKYYHYCPVCGNKVKGVEDGSN